MEAPAQTLKKPLLLNEGNESIVVNKKSAHFSSNGYEGNFTTEKWETDGMKGYAMRLNISPTGDSEIGEEEKGQIKNTNELLHPDSSSIGNVNSPEVKEEEPVGIVLSATNEVKEIYLKKIYIVPPNHEFYCPKCNVQIEKVLFCRTKDETETFVPQGEGGPSGGCFDSPIRCSACFTFLVQKGKEWFVNIIPNAPGSIQEQPIPRSGKGWEVVKSFVYGGLPELIASLSVVTSAASADATTLNIVVMAIANLIGGLILLVHNLRDLKATKPIEQESETEHAPVDKYYELLGNRDHFYLHAIVAIISFLIFGLLPPLVYGFSFFESDDKDLKLAALALASLIAITVLAIAKAYAMRSNNNFFTTFKTVFYYVFSGVLASLLTYVAGSLFKRLIDNLGWFEPGSNVERLSKIPRIGIENSEKVFF